MSAHGPRPRALLLTAVGVRFSFKGLDLHPRIAEPSQEHRMPEHPARHHAPTHEFGAQADVQVEQLVGRTRRPLTAMHKSSRPRMGGHANPNYLPVSASTLVISLAVS